MKKIFCFFIGILLLFSCQQNAVDKPDNLIDEATMENILYDLSLFEAIRTSEPISLSKHNITATSYIYEKYAIDSAQFANSNHYYASDLHEYLKMHKRIEERLTAAKTKVDTLIAQENKKKEIKKEKKELLSPDAIKSKNKLLEKIKKN